MTVLAVSPAHAQVAGDETYTSDPSPMTAEAFLGQWKDSIGHDVCVKISEGLLVATLTKPEGGKPKELCIHMDMAMNWRCGNGVLHETQGLVYRKDSKQGQPLALSWITWNGKMSKWTRCAERSEAQQCKDKEAWWKMTEEWDAERVTNDAKEDDEPKAASRPTRRSKNGKKEAHQTWRKVVECKA